MEETFRLEIGRKRAEDKEERSRSVAGRPVRDCGAGPAGGRGITVQGIAAPCPRMQGPSWFTTNFPWGNLEKKYF